MSGVIKTVKKAFKSVIKVIKKIAVPLLVLAAVYFTAGIALAAFPSTAGFAAALPGFGGAAGAGTGILSKLAVKVGLGSIGSTGGISGAALSSAMAANGATAAIGVAGAEGAAAAGSMSVGAGSGVGAVGAGEAAAAASGVVAPVNAGAAVGAATTTVPAVQTGGMLSAFKGMSLADKLLLASTSTSFIGGLTSPSEKDIARAQKSYHGAFYGVDAKEKKSSLKQSLKDVTTKSLVPDVGVSAPVKAASQSKLITPSGSAAKNPYAVQDSGAQVVPKLIG